MFWLAVELATKIPKNFNKNALFAKMVTSSPRPPDPLSMNHIFENWPISLIWNDSWALLKNLDLNAGADVWKILPIGHLLCNPSLQQWALTHISSRRALLLATTPQATRDPCRLRGPSVQIQDQGLSAHWHEPELHTLVDNENVYNASLVFIMGKWLHHFCLAKEPV